MNLLLDTHGLLWWLDASPTLSEKATSAIADGSNLVFVSVAVIWEIRIKQALDKLEIPSKSCSLAHSGKRGVCRFEAT